MPTPRSRTAAAITLLFLVAGAVVVVLAVVAVARDVRDDAAWAAIVLGLAVAAWGVWFHGITDDTPRPRADRLGTVAVAGIIAAGAYWILRGPLDRQVGEAAVVATITFGLWLVNRALDARIRRRRAEQADQAGGAGGAE